MAQDTTEKTFKWKKAIKKIVYNMNATPMKSLGGEAPKDIGLFDDPKTRLIKYEANPNMVPISWKQKLKNQEKYMKSATSHRIGDFVLFKPKGRLDYQKKRKSVLLKIKRIIADRSPALYECETLSGRVLRRKFYKIELKQTTLKPGDRLYIIEALGGERVRGGKKQVLVKYKNWPHWTVSTQNIAAQSKM